MRPASELKISLKSSGWFVTIGTKYNVRLLSIVDAPSSELQAPLNFVLGIFSLSLQQPSKTRESASLCTASSFVRRHRKKFRIDLVQQYIAAMVDNGSKCEMLQALRGGVISVISLATEYCAQTKCHA
jgi:hypothetical protein